MSKLTALILHKMGDPRHRREAVRSLEYMIPEVRPDLNCIVHDADLPFPDYLKDIKYHLICLGPTFLGCRHSTYRMERVFSEYEFIEHSDACKVALPQDDYDSCERLDGWMQKWKINRIYTVISNHWDILYPRSIHNIDIKLGYTGYISDEWIKFWSNPKPFNQRKIDISYRSHDIEKNRCYLRNLKYAIAQRFTDKILEKDDKIKLDISNKVKDTIVGLNWHKFITESKFCLTTPSGSSLADPTGSLKISIKKFENTHPEASFKEVEKACFPGMDNKFFFTSISPRNLEASLAETVQIATPGSYSNLMSPHEHFLPLQEDCGNVGEILEFMKDYDYLSKIRLNCKESILSEPRLRRKNIVAEIISFAESHFNTFNLKFNDQQFFQRAQNNYQNSYGKASYLRWKFHRIIPIFKTKLFTNSKK